MSSSSLRNSRVSTSSAAGGQAAAGKRASTSSQQSLSQQVPEAVQEPQPGVPPPAANADADADAGQADAESGDGQETDGFEDEFEDEDEEPTLSYKRLVGTLSESLKQDAVSCMGVSDRFLAIGTHWGVVHIMDLIGTQVKRFQCHTATVNQVSIDTDGEFVASASDDGNVVINSLYTSEVQTFNFRRPVKAVCLEPGYSRKPTRQFVSGGMAESLIMSGRGWFGNSNVVLHSGEGPIFHITWRGTYIAWANESGVAVYDTATSQRFGKVERSLDSPRADLFRCSICWTSDTSLLIGWADSVKVIEIKERSKQDVASGMSPKYVEVVHQFQTEFVVCGIAPLKESLLLLGYVTNLSPYRNVDILNPAPIVRQQAQPPEIHIVDMDGTESDNDVLSLIGYEHFQANDYRLVYLGSDNAAESSYYIVSPKDIVLARVRDMEEHIEWLVKRQMYAEALQAAEAAGAEYAGQSKVAMVLDIGQKYIAKLMAEEKYNEAAASCPKLLRTNADLWEHWVHKFAEADKLNAITAFVPLEEPQLSKSVYELILVHYLDTDPEALLQVILVWPVALYDVQSMIQAVHAVYVKDPDSRVLMEIMLELYERNHQWDMVLVLGLRVFRPHILDLVVKHNLFQTLEQNVVLVMKYDQFMVDKAATQLIQKQEQQQQQQSRSKVKPGPVPTLPVPEAMNIPETGGPVPLTLAKVRAAVGADGVQLLAGNTDRILPFQVHQELQGHDRFLHVYLDALFINDTQETVGFHALQVELYAEYDPPRLMHFLRTSTHYPVAKAYDVCERRDLVPEMVYLLGKMGNSRRALMLIIERLGDVERAIQFTKEQADDDLWDEFLKYAMDKPPFIVGLLENLSSQIDPLRVIRLVPRGLAIPGLKRALIKIMSDCSVQKSLREGCEKILLSDTWESLQNLHRLQRRGICMSEDVECAMCSNPAVTPGKHAFHESCLNSTAGSPLDGASRQTAAAVSQSVGVWVHSTGLSNAERAIQGIYGRHVDGASMDRGGRARRSGSHVPAPYRPGLICPICRSATKAKMSSSASASSAVAAAATASGAR
ncbi:hypothetical protein BC831DRAFT_515430 [Entophlyctis helioformis]|nr:hypothetical protein BC831DRAFT_515430 [Entophlyctis helioformis]